MEKIRNNLFLYDKMHFEQNNNGDFMARVLFIVGSRRKGNSYHLMKCLSDGLARVRISTDTIIPGNQKIYLCTGCMDCDKNGICDFNDDMKSNIDKVKEAEVLIFITPTRWNTMSGDLKIFIDRLNPLYSNKGLRDKRIITIAIGSKKHDDYSTDGALTSLGSFIESAEAKVIYSCEFDCCLDFTDVLNQGDKIDRVLQDIIKAIG